MKVIKLLSFLMIKLIRLLGLCELYQKTYNPKGILHLANEDSKRNCDDRFNTLKAGLNVNEIRSYLDIGSQLGYFVFKMTEANPALIGQGVELDPITCAYSNAIVMLNEVKNVSFTNAKMSLTYAEALPNYDIISFLSVFHHVVHFDGFEAADKIMRELYKKTNKYFAFETGQFDEKGYYWSENLSFMGNEPLQWIQKYLEGLGYKEVKHLASFGTHLSDKKRGLFLCKKV